MKHTATCRLFDISHGCRDDVQDLCQLGSDRCFPSRLKFGVLLGMMANEMDVILSV